MVEKQLVQTCTRRIQFCAGHRVLGHEGKCANLHGHNYVAFFTAQAQYVGESLDGALDPQGRVIDFSVLRDLLGGWIDDNWDHGMVLNQHDQRAQNAVNVMGDTQLVYLLPYNPTAENMARFLYEVVAPQLLEGLPVQVVGVRLWETENCYADVGETEVQHGWR